MFCIIGSCGMLLQEVSLQIIWNWNMLKEANGNPTASGRNPNKNCKKLQENRCTSNFILRDILVLFGDLTIGIPHKVSSKSTEEFPRKTRNSKTLSKTQEN